MSAEGKMAPRREARANLNTGKRSRRSDGGWTDRYLKWDRLVGLLTDPRRLPPVAATFVVLELFLNALVIEYVPYTEIDWRAYMQEVEGFVNGTRDYGALRGDTGPLVYPAGFVYAFTVLYYVTSRGALVRVAQYFYVILYVATLALVARIYARARKVPPYVLILMCCTSYRIHSIYVLRLFNDPLAMVLLYASINAFLDDRWYLGSVLYSLAVSVKMNVLLYAPALLVAYLCSLGAIGASLQLLVCALVQLILGLPFLLENPLAYVKGSFDLGRIFEFRWTVNWRFLPEHVFVHPYFHVALLILHVSVLLYCAPDWIVHMRAYATLKRVERDLRPQLRKKERVDVSIVSQLFVYPLFVANFVGVTFSRSLHYQFYVWYYHTLPYLAWCTDYNVALKLTILGVVELCWNTYPSTMFSSAALHLCHLALLYRILKNRSSDVKEK